MMMMMMLPAPELPSPQLQWLCRFLDGVSCKNNRRLDFAAMLAATEYDWRVGLIRVAGASNDVVVEVRLPEGITGTLAQHLVPELAAALPQLQVLAMEDHGLVCNDVSAWFEPRGLPASLTQLLLKASASPPDVGFVVSLTNGSFEFLPRTLQALDIRMNFVRSGPALSAPVPVTISSLPPNLRVLYLASRDNRQLPLVGDLDAPATTAAFNAWCLTLEKHDLRGGGGACGGLVQVDEHRTIEFERYITLVLLKSSPLAVALRCGCGLTAWHLEQDHWPHALLALPQAAVAAIMAAPEAALTAADVASLEQHATIEVLKVTPSVHSCAAFCRVLARFATEDVGRRALLDPPAPRDRATYGAGAVREALVTAIRHAASADARYWACCAIANLAHDTGKGRQLLGTAVRDALVSLVLGHDAHNALISAAWCRAVVHLTSDECNALLLRVEPVREAHARLADIALAGDATQTRASWEAAAAALGVSPTRTVVALAEEPSAAAATAAASSAAPHWLALLMTHHNIQLEEATVRALLSHDITDADTFTDLTEQDLAELQLNLTIGARKKLRRLVDAANNQQPRQQQQRQQQSSSVAEDAGATAFASSLAEMTPDDLTTTQRFAARLPARFHLPLDEVILGESLTSGGGMGAVMTARLRSTREQCVVKIDRDRNPAAVKRFLREIYISLTVQHRFIARPLGVAFARSDVSGMEALLVLERGVCSLEDFVVAKRQRQSAAATEMSDAEIEQYFGFARQIATAMAILHARGGLHLDQKPANVVLFSTAATTSADSGLANVDLATLNVAKIVDLGLAVLSRKELEEGFASPAEDGEGGAAAAAALTHITATSLGATIAYASLEQVNAGPGTQVRPTMDVYSFGAILYRLLCVAKPHAGRNAAEILQHKLIDDAMNEDSLLPAFRAVNNARTAAAKQLVAVMRMCLQHEPEKRPQTGTDVLRLLLRDDEQLPSELAAAVLSPTSSSNMSATLERARSGLTAVGVPSSSSGSSGSDVSVSGQVAIGGGCASTSTSLGLVGLQ